MKKVIYAWNYLEWGGAQVHFLALIKEARNHFDVLVVLPSGFDEKFLSYLGELNVSYELFTPPADYSAATTIFEKIRRHYRKLKSEAALLKILLKNDLSHSVIHIDLLPHSSLLILILLALKTDVFITSHNALPAVSKMRERLWRIKAGIISKFATFHVFCSNEHAKRYFQGHYGDRVASEIKVTYTSINPDEIESAKNVGFDRDAWFQRLNISANAFVVLTVGNFIDRKGRWTLLDAAKAIHARPGNDDVFFVWLSPQLPIEADARRVEGFGLGRNFQLLLSNEIGGERIDVLRFFMIADVFALPSFVEGLPIALLEAMAIGVSSISTNVYGIPEALIDDRTGLLIEPGDSEGLAETIGRLKEDPELRKRLAKSGREFAILQFDEREVARRVVREYMKTQENGEQ